VTEFFEAFNPAARHLREQKDLQKVLVVQQKKSGRGPQPLDLDSGVIRLVKPGEAIEHEGPVARIALPKDLARAGRVNVRATLDGSDLLHTDPYLDLLRDTSYRAENAELWVAVDDGAVVGTVTWCPVGSPLREVAGDDEGEFRMLAVDPQAQRRGVGRLLVAQMIERARESGCTALVLSTADWMTAALALYRSLGFQRVPERDWSPREDVALMVFRLPLDAQEQPPRQ